MPTDDEPLVVHAPLQRCLHCDVIAPHHVVEYKKDSFRTCTHCGWWFHFYTHSGKAKDLILVAQHSSAPPANQLYEDTRRTEGYKRPGPSWTPLFHRKKGPKPKP